METKGYPQKQKNINVRKVKNVLGIDTETIMDLQNAMPFDIGYVVYNNNAIRITAEHNDKEIIKAVLKTLEP